MDKDELLAKQWHKIYQASYNSEGNKFIEAEAIRNRMFLLDCYKSHNGEFDDLFAKLSNDYGKIVDPEKGLNGYRNTLLADISSTQNRSRFWSSELTKEKCFKMPHVAKLLNQLEKLDVSDNVSSVEHKKLKWMDDIPVPTNSKHSFDEFQNPATTQPPKLLQTNPSFHPTHPSTSRLEPNKREVSRPVVEPVPKRSKFEQGGEYGVKGHDRGGYNAVRSYDDDGGGQESNKVESNYQSFKTAKQQLISDQKNKKTNNQSSSSSSSNQDQYPYGTIKKSLGTRRGPGSKFVPPVMNREESENEYQNNNNNNNKKSSFDLKSSSSSSSDNSDPRLQNIDPNMVERISNEIMDHGPPVSWDDIAGLEFAKKTIKEIVVWPMLRPDIFTGLRGPPKGLLLFGPPGTGKTLIGKCIASQSQSTFFSISASTLTSKWVGEGEKMVRALFAVAKTHQPAVIFIDEIDSLLTQRSDTEHESSRRIKTEFLVQLDGTNTGEDDRILVVGATNRPQEIDEAARRRFVKRLYIPLPEMVARIQIIRNLLTKQKHSLSQEDMERICMKTEGYSGADMANLCKEAALGPIRRLDFSDIENIRVDQVQDIDVEDFSMALRQVKASVSDKDLDLYLDWNKRFGSWGM